tara:strand:+ start:1343 stop:1690 length:348 start_codon:yes stop_codon:yes gene_type:complete
MARYAIIEDKIVINVAESDTALESNWYICDDIINIGDLLVNGVVVPKYSREDYERMERDHRLVTEVDPIVSNPLRWADLSATEQLEMANYRTALLNISAQEGFPHNIVWPVKGEV